MKSRETNHQDDERTFIKVALGTMILMMVTQQIRCKSYVKIRIQIFWRTCRTGGCNSKGALETLCDLHRQVNKVRGDGMLQS